MRYAIITYGSRGDVQPFIALALGLMARGHKVRLLAPENFKDFVEGYRVTFFPLHGNAEELPAIRPLITLDEDCGYHSRQKGLTPAERAGHYSIEDGVRRSGAGHRCSLR